MVSLATVGDYLGSRTFRKCSNQDSALVLRLRQACFLFLTGRAINRITPALLALQHGYVGTVHLQCATRRFPIPDRSGGGRATRTQSDDHTLGPSPAGVASPPGRPTRSCHARL